MSPPAGRGGRRRRNDDGRLVLISWRDIPAQVNGGSGADRVQRILPRRFQRAIDRAAMVAGKTQASQYVGEWRRSVIPSGADDPEEAAMAAAASLEEAFPRERLDEFVKTGGWDPDRSIDSEGDPQ
ncbi:MAG: virulence factor [Acidimicrobiaceae bacterium]|nr:virulence factor [Acidimicrobiaceae bacterium]